VDFVARSIPDGGENGFDRRRELAFTDIHCHCLPGLDDGPSSISDSLALCRMLVQDGISVVVATPHQLGRYQDCNEAVRVRQAANHLNKSLKDSNIALEVLAGAEVRIDERICQLLAEDKILTVADNGKYILLELPHQVFIDIDPLLVELCSIGIQPIIPHAERIFALTRQPEVLSRWLDHGTHLQINASSLLGDLGSSVREIAWGFLSSGAASFVATDAHDTGHRRPRLRAAYEHISCKLGRELAYRVCVENPSRVLNGRTIPPILPRQEQEVGG